MATLEQRPVITVGATLALNEAELRALVALTAYGDKEFLKMCESLLNDRQMKEHAGGLTSFFNCLRQHIPQIINLTDDARKVFTGQLVAAPLPEDKPL